jgi:hypothetical protein
MEHTIETSAARAAGCTSTPVRGWVVALLLHGGFLVAQTLVWMRVARERTVPIPTRMRQRALPGPQETPFRALWVYPQGWLLGVTMGCLAATWPTVAWSRCRGHL